MCFVLAAEESNSLLEAVVNNRVVSLVSTVFTQTGRETSEKCCLRPGSVPSGRADPFSHPNRSE